MVRKAYVGLLGRDEATFRRLRGAGRVVYGPGSYGVPRLNHYDFDPCRLVVGSYTSIAVGSTFMLGGQHPSDRVTTYPLRIMLSLGGAGSDGFPTPRGDTVIGSDVWIGTGALILGGVSIGDGAIVGAGAVVTKDVEPYAIVVGNPARAVSYRHTAEQRAALLRIRWWDWPERRITEAVSWLADADIDGFIAWASRCSPA